MVNGEKTYFQMRESTAAPFSTEMCPGGRLPVVLDQTAFNTLYSMMRKLCKLEQFLL